MIDYTNFNHQDFIEDPSFRRWVYEPGAEASNFWEQWILAHPHKEREVELARSILLSIRGEAPALSTERIKTSVKAILTQLDTHKEVHSFNWQRLSRFAAAAAIVLMLGCMGYFYSVTDNTTPVTYTTLTKQTRHTLTEIENTTSAEKQIRLPDGSTVILLGHSKISFPAQFHREHREVYLSGEAFFEVTKNPSQPFYVYANELVTKVLGTSFLIKAYETDKEVRVIVKTGKVSVFTRSDQKNNSKPANREENNLVLTPDQQAVLLRDKIQLIKSVVVQPALALNTIEVQSFNFDRTPVAEVFATLEKAYGIDILFDSESVENCTITAAFDNEPLPEKLQLICTIIEADYKIIDKKVIINAKGCQ